MQRSPQIVRMILMVVIGILLGMVSAPRLEATQPIQSESINVSQSEVTTPPLNGRGTGIRENQIRIEQYAFGRMDVLECLKPIEHIELALKPNSAPLNLVLKGGNKRFVIELSAQNWRLENQGAAKPYEKPWDSKWVTQDEISECRIAPQNGQGLLSNLRINDLELVQPSTHWEAGLLGGVLGLLFGWIQKRLSAYVILLATAIVWNSVSDWTTLAEQLALTQTPVDTCTDHSVDSALALAHLPVGASIESRFNRADETLVGWCGPAHWHGKPRPWAVLGVAVALSPDCPSFKPTSRTLVKNRLASLALFVHTWMEMGDTGSCQLETDTDHCASTSAAEKRSEVCSRSPRNGIAQPCFGNRSWSAFGLPESSLEP